MQAALRDAEQQLTQMRLDLKARQAQLDTQHQELDGLRKLAEAQTAAMARAAEQAEETQQQLAAAVTSLQVSLTGEMHTCGCVIVGCLATGHAPCKCLHHSFGKV